jgi:Icc-related predicted phosphoesterase
VIRIAAAGDIHISGRDPGRYRRAVECLPDRADVFLLAGDLTTHGDTREAEAVVDEVGGLGLPTIAVLGNHDYQNDREQQVIEILERGGIQVLEGTSVVVTVGEETIGIAGTKGFGGGFLGACGSDFGEPEMKAFIRHSASLAQRFEDALAALNTDVRVALMHYSPVRDTLSGEPLEIFPFLGSYLLAEAVDRAGADLVLHGHAHRGSERGITPQGTPVRNVAIGVIKHGFSLYALGAPEDGTTNGEPVAVRTGSRVGG